MQGPAVLRRGRVFRLGHCASCARYEPIETRGLCSPCYDRHHDAGTHAEYGYVKADRLADYALIRPQHLAEGELAAFIRDAARRIGVSERTAWRYETGLRKAAVT